MEEANEVQEALSRSYGTPEIDEDELEAGCVCVFVCLCVYLELRASLFFSVAELDALGDELLLDDDSSYLDEASSAPSIPEGIPSDTKTNKVQIALIMLSMTIYTYSLSLWNIYFCDLFCNFVFVFVFLRMAFWSMSLAFHRSLPHKNLFSDQCFIYMRWRKLLVLVNGIGHVLLY